MPCVQVLLQRAGGADVGHIRQSLQEEVHPRLPANRGRGTTAASAHCYGMLPQIPRHQLQAQEDYNACAGALCTVATPATA